jgi:peptidoglycan hydrolase-like protein with peptidoglycan-binding domain
MSESTTQQREIWKQFECNPGAMTVIDFGPDRIRVAPPGVDAFHALASVLLSHGYQIRVDDTDSYCCRAIKGGTGRSLHSYGIAVDVNWDTNPFKETPDSRNVRFSDKPTQQERAQDVKLGHADTDMTPEMINDVRAIKTNNGKSVFEWGGNWTTLKDTMHFELDVTPADLQTGIDWNSVKKSREPKAKDGPEAPGGPVSNQLALGARGDDVKKLQLALGQRGFPVGDVDGIYGNQTANAVRAFQASQGLSQTGTGDGATLRAIGAPTQQPGGMAMKPEDVLRLIFGALLGGQQAGALTPPASHPGGATSVQDVLQLVLNALITNQPTAVGAVKPVGPATPQASTTTPSASPPPVVLSPIDQWLGGDALAGKKTALAVVAYVALAILQATGVAGTATGETATTTGQILTTLIAGFGGLGLTAKIDRIVQALGLIAAKPPSASK